MNKRRFSWKAVVVCAAFLAAAVPTLAGAQAGGEGLNTEGNKERGRALYSGALPFEKGGAPCLACHGIAGFGAAGGANFGVDLTGIYEDYGPEGVASILESLPFPSMEPIFSTRPLTPSEQADLMAFFAEVTGNEPVQINTALGLQTGAGVILLLILAMVIWRGRLSTVRRSLVEKATREDKVK